MAGKIVQSSDDSWKSNSHGRLNFSANLFNNWIATSSEPASCIAQTIDFTKPGDTEIATAIPLSASASSKLKVSFRVLSGEASIAGNILTATQNRGLVTIAAEAGDGNYCHTRTIQTLVVFDRDLAPLEGRWIGASWASWSPGNIPMSWDSTEKLFKASVTLAAGTAEFKFSDTNNWSENDWGDATGATGTAKKTTGGGKDTSLSVTKAGNYIIRFNPYSLAYSVTAN
ncbi:MAG TPA: SusF/SusE family outer membrane protein [Cellvibrio sp.]|nr:SusF/SusE family outer membrane protein [Cellvibrio sp.]